MERFAVIVNGFSPLTSVAKISNLAICGSSGYASVGIQVISKNSNSLKDTDIFFIIDTFLALRM